MLNKKLCAEPKKKSEASHSQMEEEIEWKEKREKRKIIS